MRWLTATIGSICRPTGVRDPRETPDESFLYVDISSIDREQKTITQPAEIPGADPPSRARKEIKAGDILVSTVRPNLNAVAIVPAELDGQIASTGFCVLRPDRSKVEGRYLFYFVRTKSFIETLSADVRGAHYPAVSDRDVMNVEIPLPPLPEQRRIVEILDQADALRKKRAEVDAKAARILPALFYKMFGDPALNAKGWTIKPLSEHGASVRYGLGQPPAVHPEGVPLVRATNISRGTITAANMPFVDPKDVPAGRNAFLRAEEILVVRSGAYTGDIAQVTEKWAGAVAGYDLIINPGNELISEFLESYLLTSFIQNAYFNNLKPRAGQPHLNVAQVSATPVPIVPMNKQIEYATKVHVIRSLREQWKATHDRIDSLFGVLLNRAFKGDLTAKWREVRMKELIEEMGHQTRAFSQ